MVTQNPLFQVVLLISISNQPYCLSTALSWLALYVLVGRQNFRIIFDLSRRRDGADLFFVIMYGHSRENLNDYLAQMILQGNIPALWPQLHGTRMMRTRLTSQKQVFIKVMEKQNNASTIH
jgi:hypothetical protein